MAMIVEIIPEGGIGRRDALVVPASQIIIRQDDGTPLMVAAVYGPEGAIACGSVSHDEEEFNRFLRMLNIHQTVMVQRIKMPPPPPGARLVAGPKSPSLTHKKEIILGK